ncbi:uncharacterized protein LOC135391879 isoform X2 [Ornithodoros turicata]
MMSEFSKNLRVLVDKALGQYENLKESELYKVYFKEDPVLAACFAVCLGIICVPVLTFVTFMLVVGLLTFLGFLFVEGTLIVITVIVAICIFHFVGIFVVSAGSCVYIFYRILVMLNLISFVRGHGGQGAGSGATGTKQE